MPRPAGRRAPRPRRSAPPSPAAPRRRARQWWKSLWCAGKSVGLAPVAQPVAHADGQLGERREHVELRQRERGEAGQPRGVAQPTRSSHPQRRSRPVTVPYSPPSSRTRSWSGPSISRRERPLADARHVRLGDADHRVDPRRADADAGRRAPGHGRRRGDERVRAVVEVEQRSVRALEEHALAVAQRAVDEERGVRDVRPQPLGVAPRSAAPARRARPARRRRRARARGSSRRARPRSSGGGSSGRAGPARGCRAGRPCPRRSGRSRGASSRSGACRAAARSPGRWRRCQGMTRCALPERRSRSVEKPRALEVVELLDRGCRGRRRSRRRSRIPCRGGCPTGRCRSL